MKIIDMSLYLKHRLVDSNHLIFLAAYSPCAVPRSLTNFLVFKDAVGIDFRQKLVVVMSRSSPPT